jgi:hypothetical protein
MIRHRLLLERGWVWWLLGLLVVGMLGGIVAMVGGGIIPDPWGNHVRGYTVTGIMLGVLVVLLGGLTFVYTLRKRGLQEVGGGTMMMWLWIHVVLGVVALVVALFHAGLGIISYSFSTGKILFWVFFLLVLTGIVWRLFYRVLPPHVAQRIGNYSREGAASRATELSTEIDKIAAGRSEHFRQLRDWVCAAPRSEMEVAHALAQLPPEEREAIERTHQLAERRRRALDRYQLAPRYTRWLQLWRIVHVPLALGIVPLLCVHVVGATRIVTRLIPLGSMPSQGMSGFVPSKECRSCHKRIYDQWKDSMHAHGMASPVMIAQSNQVWRKELKDADGPDPKMLCVTCHGPVGVALTQTEQGILPLSRDGYDDELLNDGIGCTVCHQLELGDDPEPGEAGLVRFLGGLDKAGDVYYGPIDDPVGNSYHASKRGRIYQEPERLCVACHNVVYDTNGDGRIEKGVDLVLQETTKEYDDYRRAGGRSTCIDCHMPVDRGTKRAADGADLWFEQDGEAPKRVVHDHSFVAVDYPLDRVAKKDPQRDKRRKLLASAVTMRAAFENGQLVVRITNSGAGHNVPTGLAFARQMWLEVKATDRDGRLVYSSGVLARSSDDLCDANTMDEEGSLVARFLRGCTESDPDLVNYQAKLVDRIDIARDGNGDPIRDDDNELKVIIAEDGHESVLQRLAGGAVARVRPVDKTVLSAIEPDEEREHSYTLPFGAARVSLRLLFRSFPPYFLRALAAGQPEKEKPRLGPLVGNLLVEEMAELVVEL